MFATNVTHSYMTTKNPAPIPVANSVSNMIDPPQRPRAETLCRSRSGRLRGSTPGSSLHGCRNLTSRRPRCWSPAQGNYISRRPSQSPRPSDRDGWSRQTRSPLTARRKAATSVFGPNSDVARIAIPSDPLYKSRLGWIAGHGARAASPGRAQVVGDIGRRRGWLFAADAQ